MRSSHAPLVRVRLMTIVVTAALAALVVLKVQGRSRAAVADGLNHVDAAAAAAEENCNKLGDLVQFISSGKAELLIDKSNAESFKTIAQASFVNNVNEPDDILSQMAGMTQSETSNAWCRDNAVIGFNDSGSFVKTSLTPESSFSFNGWAVSHDGGGHF